jgi:signal transduction histidine kinase
VTTLSFRARLTLRWTAAFGAVLLLTALGIYIGTRAFLLRNLDAQLRTLAGTELASAMDDAQGIHLHEFPADSFSSTEVAGKFVQMIDAAGRVLLQSAVLAGSPALLSSAQLRAAVAGQAPIVDVSAAGRPGRVMALTTARDGQTYIVAVGLFTDPLRATLSGLAVLLAAVSAGGLVLTGILGFALATQALEPIAHVTERARAIARGHFATRLDKPAVDDELGRMTNLLNEMLERLHGAVEVNRRFAADASHELRGPLTAMLGEIDVTLKRERTAGEYLESLSVVRGRIRELADMTENLMILVRAQEGHAPPTTEVDVEALVHELAGRLRSLAAERDVALIVGPLHGAVVYADRQLFARVLDNVLRNAVQYNRQGGRVEVAARVAASASAEWAPDMTLIAVRDTGHGIDPVDQGRVFERFYRTDRSRSRRTGGSGLGLSIAAEVTRLFGGSIRIAESSPSGTTVEIALPGAMHGGGVGRAVS